MNFCASFWMACCVSLAGRDCSCAADVSKAPRQDEGESQTGLAVTAARAATAASTARVRFMVSKCSAPGTLALKEPKLPAKGGFQL